MLREYAFSLFSRLFPYGAKSHGVFLGKLLYLQGFSVLPREQNSGSRCIKDTTLAWINPVNS